MVIFSEEELKSLRVKLDDSVRCLHSGTSEVGAIDKFFHSLRREIPFLLDFPSVALKLQSVPRKLVLRHPDSEDLGWKSTYETLNDELNQIFRPPFFSWLKDNDPTLVAGSEATYWSKLLACKPNHILQHSYRAVLEVPYERYGFYPSLWIQGRDNQFRLSFRAELDRDEIFQRRLVE